MPAEQTVESLVQRIKELEKSEDQLKETICRLGEKEEHFRFLTEETMLPIVVVQDDRIVYANRAYADLTGHPLEEILQWKSADTVKLIHPDYRDFVLAQAQKKMHGEESGAISNYQYIGIKKNGEPRWVDQYSRTVFYDGKPADMISMIDITSYKKAQEGLRQSEERYKALFERSLDCVYINDFEGNFIDANPAALELLGYGKEDIRSLNFASLLSEVQLSEAYEYMQKVIETGFMRELVEYRLKRKDGTFVDVEVKTSIIHRQGKPYAVQGIARDVSERKKAAQALQKSEELYRDLYENAPIAYYSFSAADGSVIRFNKAGLELTGFSAHDVQAIKNTDFLVDEAEGKTRGLSIYKRFLAGEPIKDEEVQIKHKSGQTIWINLTIEPVRDKQGKVVESRSIAIDITEKKRLQTQLREAKKMEAIATLAGGVAHQFNNALFVIKGNMELMKLGVVGKESMDNWTNQIARSVSKMTGLTRQLLAYAKGGKYQANTISLQRFIQEALPLLTHQVNPSLKITCDLSDEDMVVYADQTQMQMVLSAILTNSAEAMADKELIRITCEKVLLTGDTAKAYQGLPPGDYARLTIADTGSGMDEETRKRIFDPFFTTKFQGRGLGMAAAYGIIKNHDGWMSVDSEPGKGTTVNILLPVRKKSNQ